jgi:hypothetical protein
VDEKTGGYNIYTPAIDKSKMVKSVVYLNINKVVEMSNKQYENLI